jgi:hypothetical protein
MRTHLRRHSTHVRLYRSTCVRTYVGIQRPYGSSAVHAYAHT